MKSLDFWTDIGRDLIFTNFAWREKLHNYGHFPHLLVLKFPLARVWANSLNYGKAREQLLEYWWHRTWPPRLLKSILLGKCGEHLVLQCHNFWRFIPCLSSRNMLPGVVHFLANSQLPNAGLLMHQTDIRKVHFAVNSNSTTSWLATTAPLPRLLSTAPSFIVTNYSIMRPSDSCTPLPVIAFTYIFKVSVVGTS